MTANVVDFECRELPINKVVVFNDRAEISRHISVTLAAGINEVHVKNVTQSLIYDSVRVNGSGNAVIHEVLTQNKPTLVSETDSPKIADLRARLEEKKIEVEALKDNKSVLEKRIEGLDKIIVSALASKEGTIDVNEGLLENINKFHAFYAEQSNAVRAELRDLKVTLKKAEEEQNKLQNELNQGENEHLGRNTQVSVIVLESKEGGQVDLEFVYQVYNANWSPSYDFRVDTDATPTMQISYYGQIYQCTNEDWNDVQIVLSTAQPSLGGNIPELGTLEASFFRPPPPQPVNEVMYARGGARTMAMRGAAPEMMCMAMDSAPMMKQAVASSVQQQALSTEFTISRKTTVPSSNDNTKVTIGITDFKPQLVYECVPKRNTAVFLTASAVNESDLAFIEGMASIYLNNSFVAKVSTKNVSPGERFSCSLGVDTAIRVTYKPARTFHEQVGMINKSSSVVTEQLINVKNTRQNTILLTVREHIPRSTDEKIKIRVLNPSPIAPYEEEQNVNDAAKAPKEGCKLNDKNNLEWTVKLGAGQAQDLALRWAVDHPKEEKIEYNEKY